jgi:hypothetical protein
MVVTAMDVLTKFWPFGKMTLTLCRTVKAAPCFAVYLSSLTIVVIALDRDVTNWSMNQQFKGLFVAKCVLPGVG